MDEINRQDITLEAEARETRSKQRLRELASINDNLARIVAQNVAAPPELLADLASYKNKAVRKAVASNPNTPKKILFRLGTYFPQELLNNPIFDFSLLGDLRFIRKIPSRILSILTQQNNVPQFLLNYATNHPNLIVVNTAKMHVSISGEMTERWHQVVEDMMQNGSFVYGFIDKFNGVVWDFKHGLRCYGDPETPHRSFKLLTNFCEFFKTDIFFKNQMYKRNTVRNPNTPLIVLKQLARDEDSSIRRDVAENPSTPAEILELLAKNSNNGIRHSVARNPNTPIETLKVLATHSDTNIRYGIAGNPSTPAETLKLLVNDFNHPIYRAVAGNPNTSAETLEWLADNSEEPIRECIQQKSDRLMLLQIYGDRNGIIYNIAKNPSTPIKLLKYLAENADYGMRKYMAENPNTPIKILELLANDSDNSVRESVSENPRCTRQIKETIFKNFAKLETPSFSRVALFLSDYAESFVLAKNSNSISWLERYAIASNPKTPQSTLKILAQDGNRIVRATAKESLQKLADRG